MNETEIETEIETVATTRDAPDVAIVRADELHPLDGMDPDSWEYDILSGILEDEEDYEPPDLWGDALVGVIEEGAAAPAYWMVYWGDCYVGSRRTQEAARALWDHLQVGGSL